MKTVFTSVGWVISVSWATEIDHLFMSASRDQLDNILDVRFDQLADLARELFRHMKFYQVQDENGGFCLSLHAWTEQGCVYTNQARRPRLKEGL